MERSKKIGKGRVRISRSYALSLKVRFAYLLLLHNKTEWLTAESSKVKKCNDCRGIGHKLLLHLKKANQNKKTTTTQNKSNPQTSAPPAQTKKYPRYGFLTVFKSTLRSVPRKLHPNAKYYH